MSFDLDFRLALIFAIGTTGMLVLVAGIVVFVSIYQKRMLKETLQKQELEAEYQRKMLAAALESQEAERIRVAKDLHDDVGMMLMTMRTFLNSVAGGSRADDVIPDIRRLVDDTHETIRRLSWDLMPGTLERFGLTQTIRELCDRLSARGSVQIGFKQINGATTLDKIQETLLYRIIQESVTNALKHSGASRIDIVFDWTNPFLYISIADNGVGFDIPATKNQVKSRQGLGLMNVESRVAVLGGELSYKSNIPSGVLVSVKLKVSHDG